MSVCHIVGMLYDITTHDPPIPAVAQALATARERILDRMDQISPRGAFIDDLQAMIRDTGGNFVHSMKMAPSARDQENLFLSAYSTVLDARAYGGMENEQFKVWVGFLNDALDEWRSRNPAMNGPEGLMHQRLRRYASIVRDSEGFLNVLGREWQQGHGVVFSKESFMPWELVEALGTADGQNEAMLKQASKTLFSQIIAPYTEVLPAQCSIDMLGLIKRTIENTVARKVANDESAAMLKLAHLPFIDRPVRRYLEKVFERYPEAATDFDQLLAADIALRNEALERGGYLGRR